jgi:hypothetical protein
MFVVLLALAGCAGSLPPSSSSDALSAAARKEKFQPISNVTRVFVFPVYSTAANRAFFGTGEHNASREGRQPPTYKLTVDGRDTATFTETQFIEMDLQPGAHSLVVQEYGWLGTLLRSARAAPVSIDGPGQVVFIAIPTSASDIAFKMVDRDYGTEMLAGREKAATNQN